ncbi:hypothetical protein RN001_002840 [Aquatica leii]|uniref:RING finger protein 141 n=1 Tax=Aquatica leii TaxID=1421715 RepID=A0AAN7PHF7_9COLE|nr:hypothetical protein RN001_002840 [Aquatica leii]
MGSAASAQFQDFATAFIAQLMTDETAANTLISNEIQNMNYNDFLKILTELNVLSKKCLDSSGKQLVFAVKKGSDSTLFWKATVQVACIKVNLDAQEQRVESYRLLSLNEFVRVFKTLKCQYLAVQQCKSLTKSETEATKYLSTSSFFNHLDEVAGLSNVEQSECCICLERQTEVSLPCTHSYCLPCIEQWNETHDTCPICRERLESTEDTWILSEVPRAEEISEEIQSDLMKLTKNKSHTCSPS